MEYFFKPQAFKQMKKLPIDTQKRIIEKLDFYCSSDDPLQWSTPLVNIEIGSYRFRVGDYRVIFDLTKDGVEILLVGHRRDIYR